VWAARGRAKTPGRAPLDIAHGIPTFIGDDMEALRDMARANLAIFTTFPFYQRMFRASGFAEEAAKAEAGAGGASLSDRMLDAVCLIGPVPRRRRRSADPLAADRSRGCPRGHPLLPPLSRREKPTPISDGTTTKLGKYDWRRFDGFTDAKLYVAGRARP